MCCKAWQWTYYLWVHFDFFCSCWKFAMLYSVLHELATRASWIMVAAVHGVVDTIGFTFIIWPNDSPIIKVVYGWFKFGVFCWNFCSSDWLISVSLNFQFWARFHAYGNTLETLHLSLSIPVNSDLLSFPSFVMGEMRFFYVVIFFSDLRWHMVGVIRWQMVSVLSGN